MTVQREAGCPDRHGAEREAIPMGLVASKYRPHSSPGVLHVGRGLFEASDRSAFEKCPDGAGY